MSDFTSRDFTNDFLEEAGDHLRAISDNLLALEQVINQSHASRLDHGGQGTISKSAPVMAAINELFRSFHTLKGLSGMVGLAPGEQLSHALESVLRAIQLGEQDLTPQLVERLLAGARTLEAVVATLRDPLLPMPDVSSFLVEPQSAAHGGNGKSPPQSVQPVSLSGPNQNGLDTTAAELLSGHPEITAALDASGRAQLEAAIAAGETLSVGVFTPSAEKAAMGVNVSQVRQVLSESTRLIQAAPLVQGASVRFAFLVSTPTSNSPPNRASLPEMDWVTLGSAGQPAVVSITQEPSTKGLAPARSTPQVTVRVDIERLDDLLRLVGDLVVTHSRLAEILPRSGQFRSTPEAKLQQVTGKMERQLRELRQSVVRARMVPIAEVFARMPLHVRDLARQAGKQVSLVLEGEQTEVDRMLVERLLDPLLHLVRNAITHGIETPEERQRLGKPSSGRITLRAQPAGDHILVSVSDDGRGLDLKQLAEQAAGLGLRNSGLELTLTEALELICLPGFTTRQEPDLASGRGMGMDIVHQMAAETGGSLSMETAPGAGSTFTLRLPFTLTIVDALIVHCGPERYAVPRKDVDRVVEIDPALVVRTETGELMPYRGDALALVRLADLFGLAGQAPGSKGVGLIYSTGDSRSALIVDRISSLREVVVRPITDPLIARTGISGATELGDGSVILILDLPAILHRKFLSREH